MGSMAFMDAVRQPTRRQLQALLLSAAGCSREDIGRQLIISPWTVKLTLDNARKRLCAGNVTQAVAICFTHEWFVIRDGIIVICATVSDDDDPVVEQVKRAARLVAA